MQPSYWTGSKDKAKYSAKQLILITALLSVIIMVIVIAFNVPLLHMVFGNVEVDVMKNAEIYFLFSAMSYPFIALYNHLEQHYLGQLVTLKYR